MATYGFIELLAFLPGKLQAFFIGLFFLGQGALGPVDPKMMPNNADLVMQNNSYYEYELAKSLSSNTYAYGYISRLDISSQNFMETEVGKNVQDISFPDLVKTLTQKEDMLTQAKAFLERDLKLSASDIYALSQAHIEIAYTNYFEDMSEKNFVIAYYPKTDASHAAVKKSLEQVLKMGGDKIKSTKSRIYELWTFSSPSGEQLLVRFFDDKPFYALFFSQKAFEEFLKNYREKPKNSLHEHLNKKKIIKKMGRGSFFGLYLSIKDFAESDNITKSFGDKVKQLYKTFGSEAFILSDSFYENVYRNKVEIIYDSKYESVFKQLEPTGLEASDLKWVADDTRLFIALTLKNVNNGPELLGKLVRKLGGEREYKQYNKEMSEVSSELNIDIKESFKLLSGKLFFSMTGETFFLENQLSILDDVDDYLGINILKRSVFGASITSRIKFQEVLVKLFSKMDLRGKTPIVERKDISASTYKVILGLERDFPLSVYWTYIDDKVIFAFTEENIRKAVLSSERKIYPFVNYIGTENLKSNYLSYAWHDNSFFAHQLAYLYEVYLGQLSKEEMQRGGEKQFTKYLPIMRNIAQAMGQGISYTKMTDEGMASESLSSEGISFGNMFSPFMGSFLTGYMLYPMSMMGSSKPIMAEPAIEESHSAQPEEIRPLPDTRSEP